jgi:YidC/Oxa1 family membrane protein insertase
MEKRSILAIALSMLVLLVWSVLLPKRPQPIVNNTVTAQSVSSTSTPVNSPAPYNPVKSTQALTYEDSLYTINFDESAAAIQQVNFRKYQDHKFVLENGFALGDASLTFKNTAKMSNSVVFVHSDSTKKITKEFIFSDSSYIIDLKINVQNLTDQPLKLDIPVLLGTLDFIGMNPQNRFLNVVALTPEKTWFLNGRKDEQISNVKFAAIREKYFTALLEPQEQDYQAYIRKVGAHQSQAWIQQASTTLKAGQNIDKLFRIYLGPQDLGILERTNPQWSVIINYGTFDFIAQLLLHLLKLFFVLVHNWGWAIVVLSIVVYLVLYPLTLKQMRSMKEMQALQPKIENLRNLYKDNPQKLNKEIMELYRVHKVNPFGGCLPLLLQMPIFFALYQVLMRSIALKGAHFLWIRDLSEPDRLISLHGSYPVIGNEINLLPILMAIVMFFQQKMSMANSTASATDATQQQQKMMLVIFPILFGFIFYRMPSGLVLYWFVNSSLMMISQVWIKSLPISPRDLK